MLTLRGSAALLGSAGSIDGLNRLARAIGFDGPSTPLDAELRIAIGIPPEIVDAVIVSGHGSLRALALTVPPGVSVRDLFTTLAHRLLARTPHALWLFITAEDRGDVVAVGAPSLGRKPPSVAALVMSRRRIIDSDADTLRLLAAARGIGDLTTHARFVEVLGRDALSRRFFTTLEDCVTELGTTATTGPVAERKEIALLYASRLLFLGFLEAKGWLDDDPGFLTRVFDECMSTGGGFHSRVLLPLFFGTLNTPSARRARRARAFGRLPFLNGGLFTPTAAERRRKSLRFRDETLGRFFGELLSRYRFTAREESTSFEEAAIDPAMLGRTFECLMAGGTRRDTGVFYTPHELVERVASRGLEQALAAQIGTDSAERLLAGESLDPDASNAAARVLAEIRLLDPACGSGAFLVHTLDRIAALLRQCDDQRPVEMVRREVLARSIFGVDVNPTAVWLCQLRLWLSIVIDTHGPAATVPPLPNLDRNVRVGDSLAGEGFGDRGTLTGGLTLRRLRERYTRSTGSKKASLARLLDREERRLIIETTKGELASVSAARRDLVTARRGRDLFGGRYSPGHDELIHSALLRERSLELRGRLRAIQRGGALPFSFPAHFADVAATGGFTLIVGNPPWVRPHRLDRRTRERLRDRFLVARAAPWASGAEAAGAGHGFSAQVDLAALFVERSLRLLAPGAALSLLLPAKLWRSLAGGGLRALVFRDALLARVEDYSDIPASFDAAVYPGLLVAARLPTRPAAKEPHCARVAVLHRARMATVWRSSPTAIAWDHSVGAPWILVPPDVRRAFDLLRNGGEALAASRFGRPHLGVKCGLNDAFVVTTLATDPPLARIASVNGREGEIELEHLRPVARGQDVVRWVAPRGPLSLIWTHDAGGGALAKLPPGVAKWLAPHRRALASRADSRSAARWWSVFRTDGARHDVTRVIWADIGRTPRATVLEAGDPTVPLNTCYVARCPTSDDAFALSALLNSSIVSAWLSVLAEPARGGYRRYLGWTMSLLPVPMDWERHRSALSALGRRAREGKDTLSEAELLDATLAAFAVTHRDIEPLLAWGAP